MDKENLTISKTSVEGKVSALVFKDGEFYIIYAPSIHLSSYGKTIKEAYEMLSIVLSDFSQYLIELNEGEKYKILKELGWKRSKYFKKRVTNLSQTTFEDVKKQFHLPEETEAETVSISV